MNKEQEKEFDKKYMKLKDQVVSLELSKKIKELGFKHESSFYWADNEDGQWVLCFNFDGENDPIVTVDRELDGDEDGDFYHAYTVAELGEMLPNFIEKKESTHLFRNLKIYKQKHEILKEMFWFVRYGCIYRNAKTEVNARAKMLIYLKENNLI